MADHSVAMEDIEVQGVRLHVATAGNGPLLILLHGWPHTWQVWTEVIGPLSAIHRVVAMDLRGLGGSTRRVDAFDAGAVAGDILGLIDVLGAATASVVALDASVPAAFLAAMRAPERIRRLVLMESLLLPLPGAEQFLATGPPWWFGFHSVPGLAETVLDGHERDYLDWFLTTGTYRNRGISTRIRDAFVAAYKGQESLRCGFEYYRAAPRNGQLVAAAVEEGSRLRVPTLAVGGNSVGDALHRQLVPIADDLAGTVIPECGHIVPLDQPDLLLKVVGPFLA